LNDSLILKIKGMPLAATFNYGREALIQGRFNQLAKPTHNMRAMATNPEKPKSTSNPGGNRASDFSLDPLPVPDVMESDSDTAWGLWEHSLQSGDAKSGAPRKDVSFDDTVPGELAELPPTKPGNLG
jgi:hypothetical protein